MPYAQLLLNDHSKTKKPFRVKDTFAIGALWTIFALAAVWTHPPFSREATKRSVVLSQAEGQLLAIRTEAKFTRHGLPTI